MSLESLVPVSEEAISSLLIQPNQVIGKNIRIFSEQNGFPELEGCSIAIIGVSEIRNTFFPTSQYKTLDFRKSFYKLFPGNWNFNICDLGDLPNGATADDTYFALSDTGASIDSLDNLNQL